MFLLKAAVLADQFNDPVVCFRCQTGYQALVGPKSEKEIVCLTPEATQIRETSTQSRASVFNFFCPCLWRDVHHSEPQMCFASATAVSAIRLEKPHSLSYQDK